MKTPPQLLIVDDQPMNVNILQTRLAVHGYDILTATDGEAALELARTHQPDLMLLDSMMPKMNGIEVCQRLKSDASLPFMPIVMVTAKAESQDVVAGLEAGADEYLTKPLDQAALVARVKSMLRIKELLRSHLQEVTVVFCDLRGFTAFSEATEPDDVMAVLRECHEAIGAVTNLTSRLCDHAEGGQILISQPVFTAMKHEVEAEPVGKLSLKGLAEPVLAFNVLECKATR